MNITEIALGRNRITLAVLMILFLGGYFAFLSAPRNMDPGFIIRAATVTAYFPGASPERMERLVTDKLEKAIREMPELDYVSSQSFTGAAVITAHIKESYKDMQPIWDKLRRKVERARRKLPDGVLDVVVNDEYGDVFGIVLGLTGDGYNFAELKDIADEVRDELLLIGDVAKVDIYGDQAQRVFVEYNNARLAELGLSPQQLAGILQAQNILISGGSIVVGSERIALEPTGNFENLTQLGNTLIAIPNTTRVVRLSDVAKISRGYVDPPGGISRVNGQQGLLLGVSMREGGNYITLGKQIKTALHQLQGSYPYGIEFSTVSFLPDDIIGTVDSFTSSLFQAVGIVLAVMLVFLGLRTGLIVGSLIPGAILISLLVMKFFDIGLDQMSLSSLIIALGLLVDNAIVVTESTMVRMERGMKALPAATSAARELMVPLLTSSLTTAFAFLPIFLAKSAVGEYCAPLFKVVTITLLSSWVLSMTMIPMLCALFLHIKPQASQTAPGSGRFDAKYKAILQWLLHHRPLALVGALSFFAAGIVMMSYVPSIFFPGSDVSYFQVDYELPVGTDVAETSRTMARIEHYMQDELMPRDGQPFGITSWQTHINFGGPRFTLNYNPPAAEPNKAVMVINVNDKAGIPETMSKLDYYLKSHHPNLSASVKEMSAGPGGSYPVVVRISGRDSDTLFSLVERVKEKFRSMDGVNIVNDDWGARTKKMRVRIDPARTRRAGVSHKDIARSLQTGLDGLELTQYREDDESIPVLLRSAAADRQDIGKLHNINIYTQAAGRSIPLAQVADFDMQWQPSVIIRRDGLRTVSVRVRPQQGVLASEINRDFVPWMAAEAANWPRGYRYEFGGDIEGSGKANTSIGEQMPIAALLVVLLLIAQFNSFRRAGIIISTIPLIIFGVAFGLLLARSSFGFMTMLGLISLAGIIINNAIVLIDQIDKQINCEGDSPQAAIVNACLERFRPIMLTTATTVLGLMPLWIGRSPMFESMAIAMIFGLLFGTLLTLGVVPVLYSLFFRVSYR